MKFGLMRFKGTTLFVGQLRVGYVSDEPPIRNGKKYDVRCIIGDTYDGANTIEEGKKKLREMTHSAIEKMYQ